VSVSRADVARVFAAPLRRAPVLIESVGHTPLIDLSFLDEVPAGVSLYAKLETVNPNGSLKDRPVARMFQQALAAGRFEGGRRLLDSSSGNAGIAYAAFGAALGVGVTLVIPGNASRERLDRIRAHGAEVIETDPIEGYDFAIAEAQRLAGEHPDRYWYANQYGNDDNWRAHYETTGAEILEQIVVAGAGDSDNSLRAEPAAAARGRITPDAFVCGIGTGGSITGIGRRLSEANADVHIAAVIPETFPGIEGLKPLGSPGDFVPPILDESLIDSRHGVAIEDALAIARRLARAGIFAGPSSGAYVHVALELAATGRFRRIVTLICDTGERYGSTGMWG
jgi:cysteine synthase B